MIDPHETGGHNISFNHQSLVFLPIAAVSKLPVLLHIHFGILLDAFNLQSFHIDMGTHDISINMIYFHGGCSIYMCQITKPNMCNMYIYILYITTSASLVGSPVGFPFLGVNMCNFKEQKQ